MKLNELYPGDRIRDCSKDIVFLVAGHDHYAPGTTALITDTNAGWMCFDSKEPENELDIRRRTGNGYYLHSNVHQWINADSPFWFRPSHPGDMPPEMAVNPYGFELDKAPVTDKSKGFLAGFSRDFIRGIKAVDVECASDDDPAAVEIHKLKVFLPSLTELGFEDTDYPLGRPLPAFSNYRLRYADSNYWVRTPVMEDWEDIVMPPHMRFDSKTAFGAARDTGGQNGSVFYRGFANRRAFEISGVRPILNLSSSIELEAGEDGVYILKPRTRYCNISKDLRYNTHCVCFNKTCPSYGFCAECILHHNADHPQTCRRPKECQDPTGLAFLEYPDHKDPGLNI